MASTIGVAGDYRGSSDLDERLNILSRWVEELIGSAVELKPASSDASFRRYFRVFCPDERTYIAMDAPPEHESVAIFARAARYLNEAGLNVPVVHSLDESRGFALLSDLGERTYLDVLRRCKKENDSRRVDALYDDSLASLHRLQIGGLDRLDAFEPYAAAKLSAEMELFRQWFVPCRTRHELSGDDHALINRTFDLLVASALEQPRVWVHRDFHSRNLMVTDDNNPGVLDFQDAVTGPVTYDLVSLLRDCYITWPADRVDGWLTGYFEHIRCDILPAGMDIERFRRWFDWMGVQRHVKVLGIFSRLYHRDGKADYLDDLPVVEGYVRGICDRYDELRPFGDLLASMAPGREVAWTY